jgi:hypothetical protein
MKLRIEASRGGGVCPNTCTHYKRHAMRANCREGIRRKGSGEGKNKFKLVKVTGAFFYTALLPAAVATI